MRRAHVESGKHSPARVIPEEGQFPDNDIESACSDSGHVFKENERGLELFGQPHDLEEKPASLTAQASAIPRNANVLTRESGDDEVNSHSEMLSPERSNVIPDGSKRDSTFRHPLNEERLAVRFQLHVTDGSDPRSEGESVSADAGEKIQTIEHLLTLHDERVSFDAANDGNVPADQERSELRP